MTATTTNRRRRRPTGREWLRLALLVGSVIVVLVVVSLRSAADREITAERCVGWWNDSPPVEVIDDDEVVVQLGGERYSPSCWVSWSNEGGRCATWALSRDPDRWDQWTCRGPVGGDHTVVVVDGNLLG